ncbi:MAG: hypothetical protein KKH92_01160 [Firmicutes bacterium]|nr:hypothetical protein [Bacillota bacterium]
MHTPIIQETIKLDRIAREKVMELQEEKAHIDDIIKADEAKLKADIKEEIKAAILANKEKYEKEIQEREEKEIIAYENSLTDMKTQFDKNKKQWIEDIFSFCTK